VLFIEVTGRKTAWVKMRSLKHSLLQFFAVMFYYVKKDSPCNAWEMQQKNTPRPMLVCGIFSFTFKKL